MRQIILDTETTGLSPSEGHRVLELACLEMVDRRLTGKHYHVYINPGRASDEGALRVHGITEEFLADKPVFAEIADRFIEFVSGAQLLIHNAPFDIGFLNAELEKIQRPALSTHCPEVLDTLLLARELRPGKRNNLDALCKDYGVDNSGRSFHGALLDCQLLSEVYLGMTRGQNALLDDLHEPETGLGIDLQPTALTAPLKVVSADSTEQAAHAQYLAAMEKETKQQALWLHSTDSVDTHQV